MYKPLQDMQKTFRGMALLAVKERNGRGWVRRFPSAWCARLSLLKKHA